MNPPLSLEDFFQPYEHNRDSLGWIDVRSEGEFEKSSLPGFVNLPILTNSERHQVGLTYKQKGQSEAIRLGHELTEPFRQERANLWARVATQSPSRRGIMICWRGGMRSQIAAQWAAELGSDVRNVHGGIKAIRNELLKTIHSPPELLVLSGLTGSGKTELLQTINYPCVDLERLANHRGSSFGRKLQEVQPSQSTFENRVAIELRRVGNGALLEDESISIGNCFLPQSLKYKMNLAPCVWVESGTEERTQRIFEEYVQLPLQRGIASQLVFDGILASLHRITRKLGGLETTKISRLLEEAFRRSGELGFRATDHAEWITKLLHFYYDPLYSYGFDKNIERGRRIVFRGTFEECKQWFNSHKP